MPKERIAIYIDGFNLYHALDALNEPHLKWVNLDKLASTLAKSRSQQVISINYFSAFATFYQNTNLHGRLARHQAYVRALESKGVICTMGNFAKRDWIFRGKQYKATWRRREEKQTDVAIGVHVIRDAFKNSFATAWILSCDADMLPIFREAKKEFPSKSFITVAPPGRAHHKELLNNSDGKVSVKASQIRKALFGNVVMKNGVVVAKRPTEYRPPS